MKTGQAYDVLISLDPAPTLNPGPVDEVLLGQILATTVEQAAAPRTQTEVGRPHRRRSRRRPTVHAVLLACAAAAILLAATLGVRSLTTQSSGPRHPVSSGGARPQRPAAAAPRWALAASLVGAQYEIGKGNPDAVVGLACSRGTTCLLSTGYGLDYGGGGSMFFSQDAGHTWSASTMPTGVAITSLASCADDTWCAAGGGLLDSATGDPEAKKPMRDPELMVSSDGGASWTAHPVPLPVAVQQIPAQPGFPAETTYWPGEVDDVSCPAVNVCNVLGQAQLSTGNGSWELVFLHTDDGGLHWTSQVLPNPPGTTSYQLVVAPDQSETMSCATAAACTILAEPWTPQMGIAWRTSDGGATWQVRPLAISRQVNPSLSCPTADTCWTGPVPADGGVDELMKSDDGGLSWTPVPVPTFPPRPQVGAGGGLSPDISCVSASECALSLSGIAVTTDGGASWQQAVLPAQVGAVLQVTCSVGGSCAAIADPAAGSTTINSFNGGSLILTDGSHTVSAG
jgi:photosystem II stability/assembly factor-like uncharacterized protein